MATIKIQRIQRYIIELIFRDYRLFVDGQKIGSISDGQEMEFNVSSGKHLLVAKIDWYKQVAKLFHLN